MVFKKYWMMPVILSMLVLLSFGSGCKRGDSEAATVGVNSSAKKTAHGNASAVEAAEVTFVELGSLNCIPCKMMQPVMKQVEQKYGKRVEIVFHDVWTEEGKIHGQKYRIRAIPTQIFLDKNGNEYFRHEGFFPFEEIENILGRKGVKK